MMEQNLLRPLSVVSGNSTPSQPYCTSLNLISGKEWDMRTPSGLVELRVAKKLDHFH